MSVLGQLIKINIESTVCAYMYHPSHVHVPSPSMSHSHSYTLFVYFSLPHLMIDFMLPPVSGSCRLLAPPVGVAYSETVSSKAKVMI